MKPIKLTIKQYIADTLVAGSEGFKLEDDHDLLVSNMLDSLGVMRLVEYIEGLMDMKIPPEDITIENFQSVTKIDQYLSARSERLSLTGEQNA